MPVTRPGHVVDVDVDVGGAQVGQAHLDVSVIKAVKVQYIPGRQPQKGMLP